MPVLPLKVKLIGEDTTNPALPQQNLSGTLSFDNDLLVFNASNFAHIIPLPQISKLYPQEQPEAYGRAWRRFATVYYYGMVAWLIISILGAHPHTIFHYVIIGAILIFPYWVLFIVYSPIRYQLVITAWDEEHGLDATTIIELGRHRKNQKLSPLLIQEIWRQRGNIRAGTKEATRLGGIEGMPQPSFEPKKTPPRINEPTMPRLRLPEFHIPSIQLPSIKRPNFPTVRMQRGHVLGLVATGGLLGGILLIVPLLLSSQQSAEQQLVNLHGTATAIKRQTIQLEQQLTQTATYPEYLRELRISSRSTAGTKFEVPQAGIYRFVYSRGAYSLWDIDGTPAVTCSSPCFTTVLLAFTGESIPWQEDFPDDQRAVLAWPGGDRSTNVRVFDNKADAELAAREHNAPLEIELNGDSTVTFVVGDCFTCFRDNEGDVYLYIYYLGPKV